ncbi:hypothetical protein K440DRAFT_371663 [Wilcoxina mikolae CBS 423.85]|nr:hypothetical protein K440DRAFT_371663 [Wilcoxina mikolae CBS 423.85]
MAVSILVRRIMVGQNRAALDLATSKGMQSSDEIVKTFCTIPTGQAVTVMAPRGVVIHCLLTNPRPPNPPLYNAVRALSWLGFGCHVISLGMSTLFSQILSVILLLVSTVLVARRVGDDEERIGTSMILKHEEPGGKDFRSAAYARLQLSEKEEDSMVAWNLFPQRSNEKWWKCYRESQATGEFSDWDQKLEKASKFTVPVQHNTV